ncbi:hypothetical protein AGMMS50276_29540 [Synergistales bacterium]|nr:hypothetical protein AGMMS50276_29540 [Synergistales bacterium]
MTPLQASFTAGELTPVLHARVDLAKYQTGAARLENFVVMPQGGIKRRAGFGTVAGTAAGNSIALMSFQYDNDDAAVIVLSNSGSSVIKNGVVTSIGAAPMALFDPAGLSQIRYTQSGNVMFIASMDSPPYMLERHSDTNWEFKLFQPENGPWLANSGKNDSGETVTAQSDTVFVTSLGALAGLAVNDLFRLDFEFGGELSDTVPQNTTYISDTIIVKGAWDFETGNPNWAGTVWIEKSLDNGLTWYTVKKYISAKDDDRNISFSGSESEDDVLYRVRIEDDATDNQPMKYTFVATPFVKSLVYRVTQITGNRIYSVLLSDTNGVRYNIAGKTALDWALGAWSASRGFPFAVCFYQNRLVFAGSNAEPQTIWMSKVNDYLDFGTSDPVRDDDAITLTLAGDTADRIHSLVAMTDLLAFTGGGEWRISGAGEGGAIAPSAVVAHEQTRIGSRSIQPIVIGSDVIFVGAAGTEVQSLGYSLQSDGYVGSNLSIFSAHLFRNAKIMSMTYQRLPDSLLWCGLDSGLLVSCTYQIEHEVVAWARHSLGLSGSIIRDMTCVPMTGGTDFYIVRNGVHRMARGTTTDDDVSFTSILETLSVNMTGEGDTTLPYKKLISRLFMYTLMSGRAHVSPRSEPTRWRDIQWTAGYEMTENELMLDAGFERGAALRIESLPGEDLTILALVPMLTVGG